MYPEHDGELPPDRARAALVDAFGARVRRRDPSASPLRRLAGAFLVVVLVIAGVVLTGFLLRFLSHGEANATDTANSSPQPEPSESVLATGPDAAATDPPPDDPADPAGQDEAGQSTDGGTPAAAPAAAPAKATFAGIAGISCTGSDRQNWYAAGQYTDGRAGWYETGGGYSGAGCSGRSLSVPMSGSTTATGETYVVWWFNTTPVAEGTCQFSVYIPDTGTPRDVAGRPALYKVLGGRTATTPYASFQIDQTANRGGWVHLAAVAVHNGAISLHLADQGRDPNGEHLAAAQVVVSCTAS